MCDTSAGGNRFVTLGPRANPISQHYNGNQPFHTILARCHYGQLIEEEVCIQQDFAGAVTQFIEIWDDPCNLPYKFETGELRYLDTNVVRVTVANYYKLLDSNPSRKLAIIKQHSQVATDQRLSFSNEGSNNIGININGTAEYILRYKDLGPVMQGEVWVRAREVIAPGNFRATEMW